MSKWPAYSQHAEYITFLRGLPGFETAGSMDLAHLYYTATIRSCVVSENKGLMSVACLVLGLLPLVPHPACVCVLQAGRVGGPGETRGWRHHVCVPDTVASRVGRSHVPLRGPVLNKLG
jgi:hypothetical protein